MYIYPFNTWFFIILRNSQSLKTIHTCIKISSLNWNLPPQIVQAPKALSRKGPLVWLPVELSRVSADLSTGTLPL